MLITIEELERFSGVHREGDDVDISLCATYIGTAEGIIRDYVGFDPEEKFLVEHEIENEEGETTTITDYDIPPVFKLVCLEIASLIQQEEHENIGINSKSFADTGTRSFLNVVDYTKYLQRLSAYRVINGM